MNFNGSGKSRADGEFDIRATPSLEVYSEDSKYHNVNNLRYIAVGESFNNCSKVVCDLYQVV